MMRRLYQTALCLSLCPLLAAQQVGQETIQEGAAPAGETVWAYPIPLNGATGPPVLNGLQINSGGIPVELTPLNRISPGIVKVGDAIQFIVAKDVVVRGSTALRAGTRLNCTITKVRSGKPTDRNG